ncbi:hypothetical protein E4U09_007371 [Claviceps aff. purpurea]|uniref:Uncharacterized protein n=1 Tax=Claviceps aff. purpurea TaxID=1967640 RepID=A0A9P7QKI7_9HYPO|nr:hypothetical protein E4U09_007371 [Claviceps aff. purpurea]
MMNQRTPVVPTERGYMMPPAIATPTTATTALSRPYLGHQRPLHASHTPMPAATLQQQHQPQQRQLSVFLPSQSLQQVPLQSLQSRHQPQHPPSSSHGQASMAGLLQPQLQPQRFRLLAPAPSYQEPQYQPSTMPVGVDESFRFSIPARQSGWSAGSALYDNSN